MKSISSLLKLADDIRSSYWFVPGLTVLIVVSLWFGAIWVDRQPGLMSPAMQAWILDTAAVDASNILTAIMGATISVVSLTFSIVILVLTLASGQFGSRLLYTFMRDTTTKLVLGIYSATFVFALLSLRVLSSDPGGFVPQLTLQIAILLMLLSVFILVYFLHHISVSLQVTTVVNTVGRELSAVIDQAFPESKETQDDCGEFEKNAQIAGNQSGVLQAIDLNELLSIAEKHDLHVRLCYRPGHFLIEGSCLLEVQEAAVDESVEKLLLECFAYGHRRTLVQDIEFAFQQLAEIAIRALSTGVNDPNTAMICIDQIGLGLARIMRRAMPVEHLLDSAGECRVWADRPSFSGVVGAALNRVRQSAIGDVSVSIHFLKTLAMLAELCESASQREALLEQATALYTACETERMVDMDQDDLAQAYAAVKSSCG